MSNISVFVHSFNKYLRANQSPIPQCLTPERRVTEKREEDGETQSLYSARGEQKDRVIQIFKFIIDNLSS